MARVSLGDTPTRQDTNQQRDKRTPQTSKEQAESVSKEETEQECDECDAKGEGGWERKICVVNDGTGPCAISRRVQKAGAATAGGNDDTWETDGSERCAVRRRVREGLSSGCERRQRGARGGVGSSHGEAINQGQPGKGARPSAETL